MDDLGGRVAVVTGAARGIGAGIARELAARGCRVVAVDRDGGALARAFGSRPEVARVEGDLGADDTEALAERVLAVHGPVDLVVNNVGVDRPGTFLETGLGDWDASLRVNLRGPWFFTRRLVAELIAAGRGGSVVFVSSLHDHRPRTRPHYSASKAAVAMLVRELARELGPRGIRVNAVSPGVVRSASVPEPEDSERERRRLARLVPLGRIGRPEDVAAVVAFLLSDALAGYVNGANVPVDGGMDTYTWSDEE